MSLEKLRKEIDKLDAEIVKLLGQRARLVEEIGREKIALGMPIEDREREGKVLENVKEIARRMKTSIGEKDVEDIFRRIIFACKKIEGIEVAFQGEAGSYSEEAAFRFFGPSIKVKPCETLEEVFNTVEERRARFGVVPVENSLEGSISRVYDLLLQSELRVCGEIELRVIHCLIASPGSGLDKIKKVYSHPQALAQCRNFLSHLRAELIPTYDTAGSVKLIKEKGLSDSAGIAGFRAAEIYGMEILAQGIEDNPNNSTRFFILSQEDSPPSGNDKTSIVFSIKDKPGALYQALGEFARRNINLTKLESRPTRQKPWQYNFYLDFEGHRQDPLAQEALESLEKISIFVKILGSYPKGRK